MLPLNTRYPLRQLSSSRAVGSRPDVTSVIWAAEPLLTIGQLNLLLTCIVAVMTGYLGTYSAYIEPSGL